MNAYADSAEVSFSSFTRLVRLERFSFVSWQKIPALQEEWSVVLSWTISLSCSSVLQFKETWRVTKPTRIYFLQLRFSTYASFLYGCSSVGVRVFSSQSSVLLYLGNAIDRHDTHLYQKKITRTRDAQMHTQMLCKTLTPTLEHRYVLDSREDIIGKAKVVILTIAAASDRVESESVSDDRYRAHVFFLFLQFLGTLQSILWFLFYVFQYNTNNLQVLDLLPFIVHTI